MRRIFEALGPGGQLVLAEKVRQDTPRAEAEMRSQYFEFKERMGYTREEIQAKERSLSGILRPLTEAENLTELRQAGFHLKRRLFQDLCFSAWLLERPDAP